MNRTVALSVWMMAGCVGLRAEEPTTTLDTGSGYFPFVMPGLATNVGIVDLAWLNDAPAGKHGFVTVQDGHLVDGRGRRIRFLASNVTFSSAFPDHATAERLAARFASLGLNCIRFHHMDNQVAPGGIWLAGTPKKNRFDPDQLDRLDYFIAQLKRHGIYTDINLHVSRVYAEGEDFADGLANDRERSERLPHYGKGLDRINEPMLRMQRDYARDLLTHVNPYTGLTYAADPGVAIVELNNENTLLSLNVSDLPDFYRQDVLAKWNAWLKARHGSSARLEAAWGGREPLGTNLLPAYASVQGDEYVRLAAADPGAARAILTHLPAVNWHAQLHWTGLTLEEGNLYTVQFAARSDLPRRLPLSIRLQGEDWHHGGLEDSAALTPAWRTFTFTFRAQRVVPAAMRFDFVLGNGPPGSFELKAMTLRAGGSPGLKEGESLEAGSVGSGERSIATPRGRDWTRFLAETERATSDGLRAYLKDVLGVRACILDTQASYGGIAGAYRESFNDIVDMHGYWQHPHFPGRPWDPKNWLIPNTPMTAAPQDAANLGQLAVYRVAGKPFTVSEYDHPAPSHFVAELFPLLASFGALQDWDGLFQFDWGGPNPASGRIEGFFALQQHPGKLAFLPAAALLFRRGDVRPAVGEAVLAIPAGQVTDLTADDLSMAEGWRQAGGAVAECLGRRFGVTFVRDGALAIRRRGRVDTQIRWNTHAAIYTVDVPAAKVVAGHCTGRSTRFDGATFEVAANPRNFAVLTLNALDARPTAQSRRLLLAAAGDVQNTAMGWNADHTSVGNDWGLAPTRCEGITATITLETRHAAARVFALDGSGNRVGDVAATLTEGSLRFEIAPRYRTLWYEIAAE